MLIKEEIDEPNLQQDPKYGQPDINKNRRLPTRALTLASLPVTAKEKSNFSIDSDLFRSPEALRFRNKNIQNRSHEELEQKERKEILKEKEQEEIIKEEKEQKETFKRENVKKQESFFATKVHWSWFMLFLPFCVVLIYMMFRLDTVNVDDRKIHIKMASPQRPFEEFANSTTQLVEDIIRVDLPSSGSVMDGTVSCRRFANIVEDSPAFKETGSSIARLLRTFSDKIMDAGIALEDMYRKGDMLFWVFDNEISEMMSKLNPNLYDRWFEKDDQEFFKSRIREMINIIEEFRHKVTTARKYIVDAEGYRGSAERKVRQGITEANKFIRHGPGIHEYRLKLNKEEEYLEKIVDDKAIDVLNAMEELKHAENMLKMLERSHEALDLIDKILSGYRNKLMDVGAQLGKTEKSKVTKKDLERLEKLVDILRSSQQKFVGKDTLGDKDSAKIYI